MIVYPVLLKGNKYFTIVYGRLDESDQFTSSNQDYLLNAKNTVKMLIYKLLMIGSIAPVEPTGKLLI